MAKQIAIKNSKPSAWIVSTKDRGRKSIKGGKVFLNDGDEFEIEIFNPLTEIKRSINFKNRISN